MEEKWLKWNPADIPQGNYSVTGFVQDENGTVITLEDDKNSVKINFDGVVPFASTSLEGIRVRTWSEAQEKYQDRFFFRNWFLYRIENSKLGKWAEEESCGFYTATELCHYCIVTGEEVIDILAGFEPKLSWMSKGKE